MTTEELLDALDAARGEASKPPWGLVGGTHERVVIDDHGCHVATTGTSPDAACIVAEHNAVPRLTAALRAVLSLADDLDVTFAGSSIQTKIRTRIASALAGEMSTTSPVSTSLVAGGATDGEREGCTCGEPKGAHYDNCAVHAARRKQRQREMVSQADAGLREEEWRERLAAVLAMHRLTTPRQCFCGEREAYDERDAGFHRPEWHVAHVLSHVNPVVHEIADERAAEELRAAADWLNGDPEKGGAPYITEDGSVLFPDRLEIAQAVSWAVASLRDCADALARQESR